MHYLAKVKQADQWYSKIVNKLVKMFNEKQIKDAKACKNGSIRTTVTKPR